MIEWNTEHELHELAYFVDSKIDARKIAPESYISTDNMNVDRGGIEPASKLPSVPKFSHFKENDTLFSNIRTYFRKVWLAKFEGGSSADVLVFRTKNEQQLNPIYLYYLLSSKDFSDYTVLTAKGVKMPRGDKSAMMQYKFLLPEPQFQKVASKTLKSLDDKIENNRQMNETLEGMAQAIFKSWFVDFAPVRSKVEVLESGGSDNDARLAAMQAISGKSPEDLAHLKTQKPESYAELAATADAFPSAFTTSPLGDVPEGWEIRVLSQEVDILNGCAFKSQDYVKNGIFVLRTKNFNSRNEAERLHDDVFLPDEFLSSHEKYIVQAYDYHLIMVGASVGNRGIVYPCHLPALRNQNMWCFRAKEGSILTQPYTKYLLDSLIKKSSGLASGSAREFFRKGDFGDQSICIGNKVIQNLYFNHLMPILERMGKIAEENMTLAETRDALLPKLLSGEIDVSALNDTEGE